MKCESVVHPNHVRILWDIWRCVPQFIWKWEYILKQSKFICSQRDFYRNWWVCVMVLSNQKSSRMLLFMNIVYNRDRKQFTIWRLLLLNSWPSINSFWKRALQTFFEGSSLWIEFLYCNFVWQKFIWHVSFEILWWSKKYGWCFTRIFKSDSAKEDWHWKLVSIIYFFTCMIYKVKLTDLLVKSGSPYILFLCEHSVEYYHHHYYYSHVYNLIHVHQQQTFVLFNF